MFEGEFLIAWFLAAVRATGLMLLAPVYSGKAIPAQLKAVLTLFFAYVAAGYAIVPRELPLTLGGMVVAMVLELAIGLFMGWGVRLVAYAVDFAGQVISTELGFTIGQQLDPLTGSSSNAVGSLLFAFGSLVFLATGAHQAVLIAFLRSYGIAPMGAFKGSQDVGVLLVVSTGKIFYIALQMAAPLICVNFIVSLIFSILGKAAPTMNVFAESFAVRIVVGMLLLGLTLGLTAQLMLDHLANAPELMLRLIP
ncbi:MAG: flagellar biosynthetic protein FliR [Verrucomicrobiota bacterium]